MLVSIFTGTAIQGKIGGWKYYVLVNNTLVSDGGHVHISECPNLEKFTVDKAIQYLKSHYQKEIDSGVKVRVHTSYDGQINLPSYEKLSNCHYLQTNADVYAMEIAKFRCSN